MQFGYEFGKLVYDGVVYFDHAELDLDYSGLTVVKGWNKNAKTKKKVTNGCGKSLLLSGIPNVLLNSAPSITKSGRSAGTKGSLLTTPKSSLKIDLKSQGIPYEVQKYRKGNGVKYKVSKNGKDKLLATPTKAERFIATKVFPVTETEYYTYLHLHGTRQFPLQMGTSTERMEFFTKLFNLQRFDLIREACAARKKALDEDQVRVKELKRNLAELEQSLGETDSAEIKKSIEQFDADLEQVKDRMSKLDQMRKDYVAFQQWKHDWDRVDTSIPFAEQLATVEQKISKMDGWEQEWKSWQRFIERRAAWQPGMEKAKKKIGDLTKVEAQHTLEKLTGERKSLEKALHSLRKPVKPDAVEKVVVDYEYWGQKSLNDLYHFGNKEVARFTALIDLQKQINKISQEGGKCLVCGTKGVTVKDHLAEYKKEKQRWADLMDQTVSAMEYKAYRKQKKAYDSALEEYQQEKARIEEHLSVLGDPKKYQDALDGHEWLSDNPVPLFNQTEIKMPRRRVGNYLAPEEFDSDKMVRLQRKRDLLKRLLKVEPTLRKVSDSVVDYRKAAARYAKLQDKLTDITSDRATLSQVLVNHKQLRSRAARANEEVQELKTKLADLPVLERLIEIYGKNGRKLQVMQQFAKSLETRMNDNAPLIFPEPMKFEFTVGPNSMDLMVTRGTGKKAVTSDVRFLSGAETKQFNLCFVSALIPMLPASKRSNLIVLDEVDSGMNEVAAERFRNDFLPELQKIVPHVVIITPLDEQYPNARTITVVKEGSTSKVVR
jgi:hypothetical protein